MVRIAPVNLYYNPKTLWFDAHDLDIHKGDAVVVLTARGMEFGRTAAEVFEADEARVKKLKSALKPVKRIATDADVEKAAEMERRSAEALPVFKELAAETSEDMHPVSVEYLLDGDKAVFYFEAEERVDFRDLVRKLAARFHVRIDMRQIGVRDEARMIGGLGHCGQELCCKRMGGEFCPVSIRMAKEQDLSLNPQKISGVCGRLMCCLRYEYEAYKEFKGRAPKQNAQVKTPDGTAKVIGLDVPREVVSLKPEGGKPVRIPLADFEPAAGGGRPNRVDDEAWERATDQDALGIGGEPAPTTPRFTGADAPSGSGPARKQGGGHKTGHDGARSSADGPHTPSAGRKPRRRRSTKVGGKAGAPEAHGGEGARRGQDGDHQQKRKQSGKRGQPTAEGNGAEKRRGGQRKDASPGAKQGPRPGRKSSGLRQRSQGPRPQDARGQGGPTGSPGDGGHRRTRRRSHKAGGGAGATGSAGSTGSTDTNA